MKRTYMVNGRYGYWAVDEHDDQGSGVNSTITGLTKRLATTVAEALNAAYTDGRADQATDSRDLVARSYAQGRTDGAASMVTDDVSRETGPGTWCPVCGAPAGEPHRDPA